VGDTVDVERDGPVARVVMHRNGNNAIAEELMKELAAAFGELGDDPSVRVVVLASAYEKYFSVGADLTSMATIDRSAPDAVDQIGGLMKRMNAHFNAVEACPKPVIAAINGHALGGGFVLMLGCDHRIATDADTAKLGMTEAQAGIPFPAGPLEIMRHELAPELLRRLTLNSAVLGGPELRDAGVLDELCPPDELSSRAVAMAKRMAAQPAFGAVKQQIRGGLRERLAALAAKRQDPFIAAFG
jgi:enoyl-CoA hydratase